jgi:hypothetical protein
MDRHQALALQAIDGNPYSVMRRLVHPSWGIDDCSIFAKLMVEESADNFSLAVHADLELGCGN